MLKIYTATIPRSRKRRIGRINDRSHAKAEATSKRASVTWVLYAKGYLMAKYRSPLIKARWKSEVFPKLPVRNMVARSTQYPLGSSSKNIISTATNNGCARIPIAKSVEASIASKTFVLWALSRDFTLTAIITSAFKTAVKGKVRMLTKMMKIKNAWVKGEGCCSLLPKIVSATQPGGLIWLEFISSVFIALLSYLYRTNLVSCPVLVNLLLEMSLPGYKTLLIIIFIHLAFFILLYFPQFIKNVNFYNDLEILLLWRLFFSSTKNFVIILIL